MLCLATIAGAPVCADQPRGTIGYGFIAPSGGFVIQGEATFAPTGGFLARKDFLSYQDFLGAAAAQKMLSWAEVNIGQPDGAGGVIWGGWQKFSPGQYQGQYAWFRYFAQSPTPAIIGELLTAKALCSVPNRIDKYLNVAIDVAGTTIRFQPPNSTTPQPFNKGPTTAGHPGGEPLPAVGQVVWNNEPGDVYLVSDLTLASVKIQILNGGVGVARTLLTVTVEGF
jgi:hypothetical protein